MYHLGQQPIIQYGGILSVVCYTTLQQFFALYPDNLAFHHLATRMNFPPNFSVHVWMFDVHYYFGPSDFRVEAIPEYFARASVHVTGGNMHPNPGAYVLPNAEGTYRINACDKTLWVTMNTVGGAQTY